MNSNINKETIIETNTIQAHCKRFSWTAIILGAFVGIGTSFLLNLFGVAIGLSAFAATNPTTQSLAIGGFIGLLIIAIASMSALGWVAGFVGGAHRLCLHSVERCNHGCLYGFGAWCFALILTILLAIPTSRFISYTLYTLNPTVITEPMNISSRGMMYNQGMQTSVNTNNTTDKAYTTANTSTVVATDKENSKALACTAFVSFVIFFIGALSATFAGHCGFKCYARYERE